MKEGGERLKLIKFCAEEYVEMLENKKIQNSAGEIGTFILYANIKSEPKYEEYVVRAISSGFTICFDRTKVTVDFSGYEVEISDIVNAIKQKTAIVYEHPDGIYIRGNEAGIGKYKGKVFLTKMDRCNDTHITTILDNGERIFENKRILKLFGDIPDDGRKLAKKVLGKYAKEAVKISEISRRLDKAENNLLEMLSEIHRLIENIEKMQVEEKKEEETGIPEEINRKLQEIHKKIQEITGSKPDANKIVDRINKLQGDITTSLKKILDKLEDTHTLVYYAYKDLIEEP